MPSDVAVCGKKRSGKTKFSVSRISASLEAGAFVATNINIDIAKLPVGGKSSKRYNGLLVRLPDVPTASHLQQLGLGYEGDLDESRTGLIVLDESVLSFDSYSYMDTELQERNKYLINTGKNRYSVVYIVHDVESLSKRTRESFVETVFTLYSLYGLFPFLFSLSRFVPNIHVYFASSFAS